MSHLFKIKEFKKYNRELKTAVSASYRAGEILKKNFKEKYRIIRKSEKEMVSSVDIESQKEILSVLGKNFPEYAAITEERSFIGDLSGYKWIIDPLDGTHNYIAGLPFSGISIGLFSNTDFELGVIFFPMEKRLYYGVKGEGAFLNGEKIKVSGNKELSKAVISFDNQFHLNDLSFDYFKRLTEKAFTTRILGTAINDMCMTSEGKIDGRIWVNTKICDIAAGIVILRESGGEITNFDGTPVSLDSKKVIASNGAIHKELLKIVEKEG